MAIWSIKNVFCLYTPKITFIFVCVFLYHAK